MTRAGRVLLVAAFLLLMPSHVATQEPSGQPPKPGTPPWEYVGTVVGAMIGAWWAGRNLNKTSRRIETEVAPRPGGSHDDTLRELVERLSQDIRRLFGSVGDLHGRIDNVANRLESRLESVEERVGEIGPRLLAIEYGDRPEERRATPRPRRNQSQERDGD